jgi:hypothetical protein
VPASKSWFPRPLALGLILLLGAMRWVLVLQRKCGFYPRPIHVRFMIDKVEMPHVPPRVLSFYTVISTPPTLSTDIPFMSCQLHVTVSNVTAINPTPLSLVPSIATKPTALSVRCLNWKVCSTAYKFLHRLDFTHTHSDNYVYLQRNISYVNALRRINT